MINPIDDPNNVFNILVAERNQRISECKNEINKLKKENEQKTNQINYYYKLYKDIKNQLSNKEKEIKNLQNTNKELNEQLSELKDNVSKQEKKIVSLNDEIYKLRNMNQTDNSKISDLIDEISQKDEQIKKLQNQNNYNTNSYTNDTNDFLLPLSIKFCSLDCSIDDQIDCFSFETFSEVEERIYQKYPYLKNSNIF